MAGIIRKRPLRGRRPDDLYRPNFKKGGIVKKTGLAMVHKGEKVLSKKGVLAMAKKKGMRMS